MSDPARQLNLHDVAFAVLTSGHATAVCTPADLFVMAYAFAGQPFSLQVDDAAKLLLNMGLKTMMPVLVLADEMAAAVPLNPCFVTYNRRVFCADRRASFSDRFARVFLRNGRLRPEVERLLAQAPGARPATALGLAARRPPASGPLVSRPLAQRPSKSQEVKSKTPLRSPSPGPQTAVAAEPPKPIAPPIPPPAPVAEVAVSFRMFDETRLLALIERPAATGDGPLHAVRHALAAHRLASAEQFEDLISFGTLHGVEPHRYQMETARRVLRVLRGRALLADEVGLGKTIEALIVLREYQLRGMVRRALVLVPPALVRQWAGELTNKAGIEIRTTEDPLLKDDPQAFWSEPGVVVASIATARLPRHAPLVQQGTWDLLVVDEAHHVKNRSTASFRLVNDLRSRFLLLLTATPIETDLDELYQLVTLLKPGQFATPAAFKARFVDPKDPLSLKNREKLRELLSEVMIRNTRATSGLMLPPRYVTTAVVDPLPEEKALYEQTLSIVRAHGKAPGTRMLASTLLLEAGSSAAALRGTAERVTSAQRERSEGREMSASLRDDLSALARAAAKVRTSKKTLALIDLVRAHKTRALVFTRFRDTLAEIAGALREASIDVLTFHGGQNAKEKAAALEAFQEGSRVLLATDVGGEGQNLHHCHFLVNFDLPYNPMLIEQRIGRLHRMGQKEEVRVYNLCSRGTAEERVLDLLDRRLHLFELVVGELDMVLGNLADERDLEERIVALYAESKSDADVSAGFDAIEKELLTARGRYDQVKALDDALFGKDFEA